MARKTISGKGIRLVADYTGAEEVMVFKGNNKEPHFVIRGSDINDLDINKVAEYLHGVDWVDRGSKGWVTPSVYSDEFLLEGMQPGEPETVTVVRAEKLPDTVNSWGFAGAIRKTRYIMSNGDVWVTGKAMSRHMPPLNYIQLKKNASPDWKGGLAADIDTERKGKVGNIMSKYYNKIGLNFRGSVPEPQKDMEEAATIPWRKKKRDLLTPIKRVVDGDDPSVVAEQIIAEARSDYPEKLIAECPICGTQAKYAYSRDGSNYEVEPQKVCEHFFGDSLDPRADYVDFWKKLNNPELKASYEEEGYSAGSGGLEDAFGPDMVGHSDLTGYRDDSEGLSAPVRCFFADWNGLRKLKSVKPSTMSEAETSISCRAECPYDPKDGGAAFQIKGDLKTGSMTPGKTCPHYFGTGEMSQAELSENFWKQADNPGLEKYFKSSGIDTTRIPDDVWNGDIEMLEGLLNVSKIMSDSGEDVLVDCWFADFDKIGEMSPIRMHLRKKNI
jgi:hypothetical protein